ncbi:MAG: insulinase family protein [Phycisphaeraceae bacterium]|nr:insulinase family protein [Phycisphaeraceae bacterium]
MAIHFQEHRLANGLTIVAECDADAHTAAVGFFVRTGTRDETLPVMGVSHFLEHMMFKGTAKRTADDVNREFDEIGANYNAYTSHEKTVYYSHVLPEYFDRSVDLLSDMLRPALRQADFDVEKKVILEEIGMYEDRPQWRLQDALQEACFARHALGFRVLETVASIEALTSGQMRSYFDARYGPDNITVAAAGKMDFARLVAQLEAQTKPWRATGAGRDVTPPATAAGDHVMHDPKLTRTYLALMTPGPSSQDEDRYAAAVLTDVLGDDEGSRLYWALVDPGLADEADLSHMSMDGTGVYMAFASCDPDRLDKVRATLLGVLDQSMADLTDDEVERAKNKLATELALQGENPGGRMRALGTQWTYLRRYLSLEEESRRLMQVTRDDVVAVAKKYPFSPRTMLVLGP